MSHGAGIAKQKSVSYFQSMPHRRDQVRVSVQTSSTLSLTMSRHSIISTSRSLRFAMPRKQFSIYGGIDPREIPTYGIYESAHALKIPTGTLRSWIYGRNYRTAGGLKRFQPIIALPDPDLPLLSFMN